jgi:hypothetical protein
MKMIQEENMAAPIDTAEYMGLDSLTRQRGGPSKQSKGNTKTRD